MVLPRRDGMVWASLIVAIVVLSSAIALRDLARRIGRVGAVVVAVSALATLAWASRSDTNAAAALFVAPLDAGGCLGGPTGVGSNRSAARTPIRLAYASDGRRRARRRTAVMTRRDDGFERRCSNSSWADRWGSDRGDRITRLARHPAADDGVVRLAGRAGRAGRRRGRGGAMGRAGGCRARASVPVSTPRGCSRCCRTTRPERTGRAATTCRCWPAFRSCSRRWSYPVPSPTHRSDGGARRSAASRMQRSSR